MDIIKVYQIRYVHKEVSLWSEWLNCEERAYYNIDENRNGSVYVEKRILFNIPNGYSIVPNELTDELVEVFNNKDEDHYAYDNKRQYKAKHMWAALLSAIKRGVN